MRREDLRGVLTLLGLLVAAALGTWLANRTSPGGVVSLPPATSEVATTSFAEGVQAFAALVQATALVVGGVWAYQKFVRGRLRYPRATIRHVITHRDLPGTARLLRVHATISNPGGVKLEIQRARFHLQQVLPLLDDALHAIERGVDPVVDGQLDIDWPGLAERVHDWPLDDFEIEPGETDEVTCDFIVDPGVETVQVYSHFENVMKAGSGRALGWGLTTFYDFEKEEPTSTEKTAENLSGRPMSDG